MGRGYPTAPCLGRWENVSTPVLLCMFVSMQYVCVCEVSEVDTFSRVDFGASKVLAVAMCCVDLSAVFVEVGKCVHSCAFVYICIYIVCICVRSERGGHFFPSGFLGPRRC